MPEIPFIGGSYTGRTTDVNSQRCINQWPYVDPNDAKVVLSMNGTPGLLLDSSEGTQGEVRGLYELLGIQYAVIGNNFYSVASGVFTSLGTLNTSTGFVFIEDNGTQIMVVDGTDGYLLDSGAFAEIADADFPGASCLAYQDGYFIVCQPNTDKYYISALYDGTSWDALDFASAEGNPDIAITMISDHRELWILGVKTVEVFYNSGATDFPFTRVPGTYIEKGCAAAGSISKEDNTLLWLNEDIQVVQATGYQPIVVSTPSIEYQFSTYSTVSDAIAYSFTQEGQSFYVITFPTVKKTWVYNLATKFWHEWSSFPFQDKFDIGRHRSNCYLKFGSKHLVGDYDNGKIYELRMDTFTDDGETIVRRRHAQTLHSDRENIFISRLELDFETGVGLSTGQGSDPKAMLEWSDDGGHTWSNEHWLSMGKIGEYTKRVKKNRLGKSRNRVFSVSVSEPIKYTLIGAHIRAKSGSQWQ